MRVAVPRESFPGEKRVAVVPDSVKRLAGKKIEVSVEAGAGEGSSLPDADYASLGAKVEPTYEALVASADCVVKIRVPTLDEIAKLKEGSMLVSLLYPLQNAELVRALAAKKIT